MFLFDNVLKLLAKVFRVVNRRRSVAITFLVGSPLTVYWFRTIWLEQPFTMQVVAVYSLVFLPFLLYKALLYFFLSLFDTVVIFFADYTKSYDVDFEKVRARVAKILVEKNVKYQSLDSMALGAERGLLERLRGWLHIKYPLIFVCADDPFVVIKIFKSLGSPRIQDLKHQITHKEAISVKIFFEEEPRARVLAKLIMNSLEVLNTDQREAEPPGIAVQAIQLSDEGR
ncbi:MAG: hypothetical protein V1787_03470 [Candidatus Micrarchaeota archaeon]